MRMTVVAAMSLAAPCHATVQAVAHSRVDESITTVTWRNSVSHDAEGSATDERWLTRGMVDYGLTEDLAAGMFVQGDRRYGDNLELDAVMGELRYEVTDMKDHPFYSGARLRYTLRDNDKGPDFAHVRLILGRAFGKWDARANQIIAYELGPQATGGLLFDTRFQATYGYREHHRAGLESFHDFGHASRSDFNEQTHTLGPVFQGSLTDELLYEAGYRLGVSDAAPRHTVKFFISRRF